MTQERLLWGAKDHLCGLEGVDYAIDPAAGCWNWLRGTTRGGYPNGREYRAYWQAVNGDIPFGHHIHHKCENTSCVNPDHLEAKTRYRHLADHRRADSHITLEQVLEIRERGATGATFREISEAMGLHPEAVKDIARGRTWADVGGHIGALPGNCAFELCSKPLPVPRRRSRIYCDATCRARAERHRRGVKLRPWQWKENAA